MRRPSDCDIASGREIGGGGEVDGGDAAHGITATRARESCAAIAVGDAENVSNGFASSLHGNCRAVDAIAF